MSDERSAELARGWIEAWIRMDLDWLRQHLSPDFVHISPFGRLEGRDHYLATAEPAARKSVTKLEIHDVVGSGNRAAVRFDNITQEGTVPSCDWVFVQGGLIQEIRSFYDTIKIRKVLSPAEEQSLGDPADG